MPRYKGHETKILLKVICITLILSSCELFSAKQDIDVEAAIDNKVKEANAVVLNVTIDTAGGGVASPLGTVKQGVPFSVNFTPYTDYGFIEWRAYYDAVEEGRELGPQIVEFENTRDLSTTVRIHSNPESKRVILLAYGTDRPYVIETLPQVSIELYPTRITIRFSRPIAESSFRFADGTKTEGTGENLRFKNIHIQDRYNPDAYFDRYFTSPHLSPDGRLLTLWMHIHNNGDYPEENEGLRGLSSILPEGEYNVTLDRLVSDLAGIEMGRKHSFTFEYSLDQRYEETPTINGSFVVNKSRFENNQPAIMYTSQNDTHVSANNMTEAENFVYVVFTCKTSNLQRNGFGAATSEYPVTGVRFYESNSESPKDYTSTEDVTALIDDPGLITTLLSAVKNDDNYSFLYSRMINEPVYAVQYEIKNKTDDLFLFFHSLSIIETEKILPGKTYTDIDAIKTDIDQTFYQDNNFRIWRIE